jgi:hypothetical protein
MQPTHLFFVPPLALAVVDDRDLDLVEDVGAGLAERVVRLAPACNRTLHTGQLVVLKTGKSGLVGILGGRRNMFMMTP